MFYASHILGTRPSSGNSNSGRSRYHPHLPYILAMDAKVEELDQRIWSLERRTTDSRWMGFSRHVQLERQVLELREENLELRKNIKSLGEGYLQLQKWVNNFEEQMGQQPAASQQQPAASEVQQQPAASEVGRVADRPN